MQQESNDFSEIGINNPLLNDWAKPLNDNNKKKRMAYFFYRYIILFIGIKIHIQKISVDSVVTTHCVALS